MLLHVLTVWLSFFLVTSTTEIYTLSLHDALPISSGGSHAPHLEAERAAAFIWKRMRRTLGVAPAAAPQPGLGRGDRPRSEEHTSELQSRQYLVCRLLLEKKKQNDNAYRAACPQAS